MRLGQGAGLPPSLGLKADVLTGALPSLDFTVRFRELTRSPECGCLCSSERTLGAALHGRLPSQLLLQGLLRCFLLSASFTDGKPSG